MELIRGVENYRADNNRLVLALGNFDGLHIAHRKIIGRTRFKAEEMGLKSAVFLLDPHPVKVLYPHKKILLLSSLQERAEILENMGINYMFIETFTKAMAILSPFKFVQNYLVNVLQVAEIIVGFDYTFGRQGKGTTYNLLEWSEIFDFHVEIISPVMVDNEVVSSSLIRGLIINGEVKKAAMYLGACFKRKGKVVHGDGRGRALGFPTANLDIPEGLLLPKNGVYLSLVSWKGQNIFGLTNIGRKPTFGSNNKISVEIFLLNFHEDIYAEELTVKFLCRIRDEIVFKDASFLKKQIESDVRLARKLITKEYGSLLEKQLI
ncbi:MAG: bifunctional riboflavin kinase/FAD synthetase [Dethiobacter sp.]|jgi:riboflavin kinase/FMN adenylyltransferase|nr:MAG: bifunctional riboflavin kinase/FAD synthetase [Dethiobacter sp.]